MATTKGKKVGPRVTIEWGTVSRKQSGKKVNVKATSRVVKTTADLFGLKESKAVGAKVINAKAKKGTRKVIQAPSRSVSSRKMLASVDGKVWHQIPLPTGISLAKAFAILQKGKKAYMIKFQGGTPKIIGTASKDTKSKAKAAKTTK